MQARSRRASSLLALNWLLFAGAYLWISVTQGNLLWWLRLSWGSWLSDFAMMATLGQIPAGSVWILWVILSLGLTALHLSAPAKSEPAVRENIEPDTRRQLIPNADLMDSRPELKEKILRLHQSLDKF